MNRKELNNWVDKMADLTQPGAVYWCKGGYNEEVEMIQRALESKRDLLKAYFPDPDDTSKLSPDNSEEWSSIIEKNSFVDDAPITQIITGDQTELRKRMYHLYENAMQGRTMYVVPFSMSPKGAPVDHVAVELTDSPLVVVLRYQSSLVGDEALYTTDELAGSLHTRGKMYKAEEYLKEQPVRFQKSFIISCPERRMIWSYGTYYGSIRPKQTTRYAWWV